MNKLLERILQANASSTVIWLDAFAYAQKILLAGGDIPWLDVSGVVAFYQKVQRLLGSDAITVPLEKCLGAYIANDQRLRSQLSEKRRVVYPIKALLSAEEPRRLLVELVHALRVSYAALPLIIEVPLPPSWALTLYATAHPGTTADMTSDDAETAAMYVADFLRIFATCGVDAVLLRASGHTDVVPADQITILQPIFNVADHYRWSKAILVPNGRLDTGAKDAFDIVITQCGDDISATTTVLTASFWCNPQTQHHQRAALFFGEIPVQADPQLVLDRLEELRTRGTTN